MNVIFNHACAPMNCARSFCAAVERSGQGLEGKWALSLSTEDRLDRCADMTGYGRSLEACRSTDGNTHRQSDPAGRFLDRADRELWKLGRCSGCALPGPSA